MRAAVAPAHLLFFHHAFADHLIHRRFHKPRADPLAITVPLAIVGNKDSIAIDERVELLHRLAQLANLAAVAFPGGQLKVKVDGGQHLQGLKHIAMPKKPLGPLQLT